MSADALQEIPEISRYALVKKLAEGGMGAVYEATQFGSEGFEKVVAIKTILETYSNNYDFVRLFIGEAKLVANLVHENIVQVYRLGKSQNIFYIAMEYVEGINLEEFLFYHKDRSTPISNDIGAFIISRVCRGLEYAHNKKDRDGKPLGVVHRDISPKNVMINYEGVVKLTDFGIAKAKAVMEQDEGEVLMGKVEYMSPEQANYGETDRRSDLFSLGIVMFELLTGHHIFESEDIYETLDNVKFAPIPDIKSKRADIPDDLARIVHKALERDLSKRYQTAGEMGYDLEFFMYHDRFGPTNVTLGNYMREHFRHEKPVAVDSAAFRQKSDTQFGIGALLPNEGIK